MQNLLQKWGYQVYTALDTTQALDVLNNNEIHVWLIDQHLNDEQYGLDFIQSHQQKHIPTALITADSDPDLPEKLKAMNIALLKKPLKPAALRAFLSSIKLQNS